MPWPETRQTATQFHLRKAYVRSIRAQRSRIRRFATTGQTKPVCAGRLLRNFHIRSKSWVCEQCPRWVDTDERGLDRDLLAVRQLCLIEGTAPPSKRFYYPKPAPNQHVQSATYSSAVQFRSGVRFAIASLLPYRLVSQFSHPEHVAAQPMQLQPGLNSRRCFAVYLPLQQKQSAPKQWQ